MDNNSSLYGLGVYSVASFVLSALHRGAEPMMFSEHSFFLLIMEFLSVSQRCMKWHVSLLGCDKKKPMPVLLLLPFPAAAKQRPRVAVAELGIQAAWNAELLCGDQLL